MNTGIEPSLSLPLGWIFVALAGVFLLGLLPRFARVFYPQSPGVARRAAAPVLFALLAATCFRGWGIEALGFVVVVGIVQIVLGRLCTSYQCRHKQIKRVGRYI